ncbi:unnamed protein product [Ilex paraguariensis]|uniref:adenylate dimethylallyltransferase (ADP/ATP-dependent) n=1 Tax=Ilex paraguariensis TaxID=185542 RepID=A0ABC8S1E1_9AQUA
MRMSSMIVCKRTQPFLHNIPTGGLDMQILRPQPPKEKVVVVMGATGTGKSRLSIDLATRFPAEIVNSDKMQVYEGLNIVTNKITEEERRGVPHHLLGVIDPTSDFTASNFCNMASAAMKSIVSREQIPIIAGGSNSYIEALVDDDDYEFRSRYECCFVWVDVSLPVLHSFVSERVDRMVEKGMLEEVRKMVTPHVDYSRGIMKAIGVPEFDKYFRAESFSDEETRAILLEEAKNEIKINTCILARRQLEKIKRLRNVKGWRVHRLDATEAFRKCGEEGEEAWEKLVVGPSTMIVGRFLYNFGPKVYGDVTVTRAAAMGTAMAAASH